MKFLQISLIIFLFFTSCKENTQFAYLENICNDTLHSKGDSIKKTTTYAIKANNDYLSLSDINNNSDTFFLRIEYSQDTVVRVFEFSYYRTKTTYKIYNFPLDHFGRGKIMFDNKKDKLMDFTTTFNSKRIDKVFMIELEKSNLINLSWSVDIKGYPDNDYRNYYQVQFSNKCKYNFYTFGGAFENSSKFMEAKQFAGFLTYLKKEFDF